MSCLATVGKREFDLEIITKTGQCMWSETLASLFPEWPPLFKVRQLDCAQARLNFQFFD